MATQPFPRSLSRILAACACAAGLLACGGDSPGDDDGVAVPAGDHDTYSGGPPGGVLVALVEGEPDDLNPLTYTSSPAFQAVRLMFRGLARRDSTLSGYQPDLAESWELRPDSTLVLHLRRDVHWHDGVPVTAEDVVFTIDRQREPRTAAPRIADVAHGAAAAATGAAVAATGGELTLSGTTSELLGAAWAVIQPVATMVVFSVVFGRLLR